MRELKTTIDETIGAPWRFTRRLSVVVWWTSPFVYGFFNSTLGFYLLLASSLILSVLTGREYLIASLQKIRMTSQLRARLILLGDAEFVLNSIKEDQLWRGEEVDPEVEQRLSYYEQAREAFERMPEPESENVTN